MNYHNTSNDGTYSYDFKNTKGNFKKMHTKSVTANTSPVSSNVIHPNKKHIQSLNKSEIGFSQSQQCSPSLSKSHKIYQNSEKGSAPLSTLYTLAQIGLSNSSDNNTKPSSKNSTYKNTAYYDALGYQKFSVPDAKQIKTNKKDGLNMQNKLNLKMINEYEEK